MKTEMRRKCYKLLTALGTLVLLFPNGVAIYWGNMTVYVTSYLVVCLEVTSYVESPWVICLSVISCTAGLVTFDILDQQLGRRWTLVLGLALTDLGLFTSCLAVRTSFLLLNLTLAVSVGTGKGLLQAYSLRLLLDWSNGDVGILVAIAQGSPYLGASIVNQIVTRYLNPDNALPTLRMKNSVFFTDPSILDKVPSLFLVLGFFALACQLVGLVLVKENNFGKPAGKTCGNQDVREAHGNGYELPGTRTDKTRGKAFNADDSAKLKDMKVTSKVDNVNPAVNEDELDYTPKQMLKTASFYMLWMVFFLDQFPLAMVNNYFKSFGQLWIHDDHFLTDLSTTLTIINVPVRILYGMAMDKVGFRLCTVVELVVLALVSVWYYFMVFVSRWVYFVFTILFNILSGAVINSISFVAVTRFGMKHFSTNFGLLRTSLLAMSLLCPFITHSILDSLGWFYVFACAGMFSTVGLLLTLFID